MEFASENNDNAGGTNNNTTGGADNNDNTGSQEIISASKIGDFETVKTLLEEGVDVNTRDVNDCNRSILWLASWKGHVDIVKLLLQKDANANLADIYGNQTLNTAGYYGHTEIVKLLLDRGVDPNIIKDSDGKTPLHESVKEPAITKLLLARGADLHHRSYHGWTALHSVCNSHNGTPEVVKVLLEHGIDEHAKNDDGKTAYELTEDEKILELLEQSSPKAEMERLRNEVDRLKIELDEAEGRGLEERWVVV